MILTAPNSMPSTSSSPDECTTTSGETPSADDDCSDQPPPKRAPSTFTIELLTAEDSEPGGESAPDLEWLKSSIHAAAAHLRITQGELTVRLMNDAEMTELHQHHCGIPEPTDVLTFDWTDDQGVADSAIGSNCSSLHADIAIGFEVAKRQAQQHSHPLERELLLYILHGMLHCLGYDDHTDDDYSQMHALEDEVLEAIGVGRIFAQGEAIRGARSDDDDPE